MFEYGCTLPHLPSYLEIREDHKLIKQKSGEIPGVRYCHPLMKKLDTTNFDFKNVSTKIFQSFLTELFSCQGVLDLNILCQVVTNCVYHEMCEVQNIYLPGFTRMRCRGGTWDHSLPYCRNTSDKQHFDGEINTDPSSPHSSIPFHSLVPSFH